MFKLNKKKSIFIFIFYFVFIFPYTSHLTFLPFTPLILFSFDLNLFCFLHSSTHLPFCPLSYHLCLSIASLHLLLSLSPSFSYFLLLFSVPMLCLSYACRAQIGHLPLGFPHSRMFRGNAQYCSNVQCRVPIHDGMLAINRFFFLSFLLSFFLPHSCLSFLLRLCHSLYPSNYTIHKNISPIKSLYLYSSLYPPKVSLLL